MKLKNCYKKILALFMLALIVLGGSFFGGRKIERVNAESTKTLYNLVVSVGFSGETRSIDTALLNNTYNTSPSGVKAYFDKVSGQRLKVEGVIFDKAFITLDNKQDYFLPKYEYMGEDIYLPVNENGYDNRFYDSDGNVASPQKDGVKQHIDRFLIEQKLVRDVCVEIAGAGDLSVDADQNGIVDNVTIIIENTVSGGWNQILWSHVDYLANYNPDYFKQRYYIPEDKQFDQTSFTPISIGGSRVSTFTILPQTALFPTTVDENGEQILNVGEIAHEFYHVLGVQDYYPYGTEEDYPQVGEADILGSPSQIPQYPLTYTAQKLGWIDESTQVLPIEQSGAYTLNPTNGTSAVKAYKLVLKDYALTGEYFMIEARSYNHQVFNQTLFGTGLIVYRVNTQNGYTAKDGTPSTVNYGNMYKQEVYVLRCGDKELSTTKYGGVSYALLDGKTVKYSTDKYVDKSTLGISEKSGYSTENAQNYIQTSISYSNGENTGVLIKDVSVNADGSVSFNIDFDDTILGQPFGARLDRFYDGERLLAKWQSGFYKGSVTIVGFDADGLVKYKNGKYVSKKMPTISQLESTSFGGRSEKFRINVPAAFSQTFVPAQKQMTAVYAIYDNGAGVKSVSFVGVLSPESPTFMQYLFGTTKWLVTIIIIVALCVAVLVAGIILMLNKEKLKSNAQSEESLQEDLEKQFGENYWLEENGDSEENADGEEDIAEKEEIAQNETAQEEKSEQAEKSKPEPDKSKG